MDGVLVLSEKQHFNAWTQVLKSYHLPTDWMEFEHWIGISDTENAKVIIDRFNLNQSIDELYQLKKQCFIGSIINGLEKHSGRDAFLQKASKDYNIALVSSASHIEIEKILTTEGIHHHFEFIIGNEDVTHHKPHPMPYLLALEKANIEPHQALIFEDSQFGIEAAQRAGVPVVGLKTTAHIPEPVKQQVTFYDDFTQMHHLLFAN